MFTFMALLQSTKLLQLFRLGCQLFYVVDGGLMDVLSSTKTTSTLAYPVLHTYYRYISEKGVAITGGPLYKKIRGGNHIL